MKRLRNVWWCAAAASAGIWLWAVSASGTSETEKARAAAKIVEETLRYEAEEPVGDRVPLLRPALEQSPFHPAALWHSGFAFDTLTGEWLRFDEVAQFCGKDQRLVAYRKVRSEYPNTVEGQLELARWCQKHKLDSQATAHLTRALEFNPDHPDVRRQLGYRLVDGEWMTEREIEEAEARARQAAVDLRQWKPRLEELRDALGHASRERRERARRELAAIRDPAAVAAIEAVFCGQPGEAALLGIELLGNIRCAEAAAALAWHAVFSPSEPVRQAAAKALQSQEKHDYVPLLLGAMQSRVAAQARIFESADGRLLYRHAFYREGSDHRDLLVVDQGFRHAFTRRREQTAEEVQRDWGLSFAERLAQYQPELREDQQRRSAAMLEARLKAAAKATEREIEVVRHNTAADALNTRLAWVLSEATGDLRLKTPEEWQSWWYDYNEVVCYGEPPLRSFYQYKWILQTSVPETPAIRKHSFLAAGTPVWTEVGSVPVEEVRVGDRVFACDSETGCLDLKPVVTTTVRPKAELLKLSLGQQTLYTTGGHVFWVTGKGWVKARELQPAMRLRTMQGNVELRSVEPADERMTYNLVVADFHTYFAGEGRLLTHDNTIRKPTNRIVPGLAAVAP